MEEMEKWVDIDGYEGLYQVSNFGRVRSLGRVVIVKQDRYKKPRAMHWKPRILRPGLGSKGYLSVVLRKEGVGRNHRIHRLVANAFIHNPNSKPAVNHIDANPHNNIVSNLEWCTIRENNYHTIMLGRASSYKKLNEKKVRIIKSLLRGGRHPAAIAKQFEVSRTNIIAIRDSKIWIDI